jgi:hypothetical protein
MDELLTQRRHIGPCLADAPPIGAARRRNVPVQRKRTADVRDDAHALAAAASALARDLGRQAARDWLTAQLAAGLVP